MRQRAKGDFVLKDPQGNKIFIAKGDKVFIQQLESSNWEIYSFYIRRIVAVLNDSEVGELFEPEDEFRRNNKPNRFGTRSFKRTLIGLFFLFPLGLLAQHQEGPVMWSVDVVKIAQGVHQIQVEAFIKREWWLYHPNSTNICIQPTTVRIHSDTNEVKQLEDFSIMDFSRGDFDEICKADRYYDHFIMVCPIKVKEGAHSLIRTTITYQPNTKYGPGDVQTMNAYTVVGGRQKIGNTSLDKTMISTYPCTTTIIKRRPKPVNRILWTIGHPFKRPFWK